ncbi:MAG: hypothetical protein ABIL58_18325, partial [Pseudomonadota bacterium]
MYNPQVVLACIIDTRTTKNTKITKSTKKSKNRFRAEAQGRREETARALFGKMMFIIATKRPPWHPQMGAVKNYYVGCGVYLSTIALAKEDPRPCSVNPGDVGNLCRFREGVNPISANLSVWAVASKSGSLSVSKNRALCLENAGHDSFRHQKHAAPS